jgi:hypothetical protein
VTRGPDIALISGQSDDDCGDVQQDGPSSQPLSAPLPRYQPPLGLSMPLPPLPLYPRQTTNRLSFHGHHPPPQQQLTQWPQPPLSIGGVTMGGSSSSGQGQGQGQGQATQTDPGSGSGNGNGNGNGAALVDPALQLWHQALLCLHSPDKVLIVLRRFQCAKHRLCMHVCSTKPLGVRQ